MSGRSERKEETRRRIMEAAETLFRRHGIDGVGLDAVMREAGLTHGGFYGHFASKEALAAAVCAEGMERSAARWREIAASPDQGSALARIVDAYLSPSRISAEGHGCIAPVLGAELARRPAALPALTESIRSMAESLEACRRGAERPEEAEPGSTGPDRALADFACLVGGVVLARLADDADLTREILDAVRRRVLENAPRPQK